MIKLDCVELPSYPRNIVVFNLKVADLLKSHNLKSWCFAFGLLNFTTRAYSEKYDDCEIIKYPGKLFRTQEAHRFFYD